MSDAAAGLPRADLRRAGLQRESGQRVVVRYRDSGGRATDVTGDLQSGDLPSRDLGTGRDLGSGRDLGLDPKPIVVLPDFAAAVEISRDCVIAAKPIPARVVRPASSLEAIARVICAGRPGVQRLRLGGWILAEDADGGAGLCSVIGDPGLRVPEAVDRVERFSGGAEASTFELHSPLPGSGRDDLTSHVAEHLAARGYRPVSSWVTLVAELRGHAQPASAEVVHGWIALDPAADLTAQLTRAAQLGAKVAHLHVAADDSAAQARAVGAGLTPHVAFTQWRWKLL